MLEVRNIEKSFGKISAVKNISFNLEKGYVLGVIGENGAGKSTTLRIISGLLKPDRGEVLYEAMNLFENLRKIKRKIGYLPEYDSLYDNLDAVSYLKMFAEIYGVDVDLAERRIHDLLDSLNLPPNREIGNFSKGMKRKLSIARTLVHDPDYLIYDEPTSGLDPATSLAVSEFIKEQGKNGKAVVFSAHNMFYIETACDHLLIIKGGEVLYSGTIDDLREMMKKYVVVVDYNGKEKEFITDSVEEVNRIIKETVQDGREVVRIETKIPRLEEIYFRLTNSSNTITSGSRNQNKGPDRS